MPTAALRPPRSPLARHWTLDPGVTFLNHGSFGATPRVVLEAQGELRTRMEREPVRFFLRELEPLLDEARGAVASLVGADPAGLAFVPNATTGVNAVVASLAFAPGDELLTTDHAYNACKNALAHAAERAGAKVTVARVPFPLAAEDEVVDAVLAAVTPRTRLALLDHVTSPTGLVFPIERLVRELDARGVDALVDGAHAPGMVPIDLGRLGAAYYTANCHKWLCAPKGAAFLHVREDRRERVRPTVISHGANDPRADRSRYLREFDWPGTYDPTAYLCVPVATRFLAELVPGGLPALMAGNRRAALEGRAVLCEALGVAPACPASMIGSLASVALPPKDDPPRSPLATDPLQDALMDRYGIEVPIYPWPRAPSRWVRISTPPYVTRDEVAYLARALVEELGPRT